MCQTDLLLLTFKILKVIQVAATIWIIVKRRK